MKKNQGMTLIEIMVGSLIAGGILLMGANLMLKQTQFARRTAIRDDFDFAKTKLVERLEKVFWPAIKIHFVQRPSMEDSTIYTPPASGAVIPSPHPQIVLSRQGTVVLLVDRRPCAQESECVPGTSAADSEQVFITCCDPPSDKGGNVNLERTPVLKKDGNVEYIKKRQFRPACQNKTGLSIDFASKADSQEDSKEKITNFVHSWCLAGVREMSVQVVGVNFLQIKNHNQSLLNPIPASPSPQVGLFDKDDGPDEDKNNRREDLIYRFSFSADLTSVILQLPPSPSPSASSLPFIPAMKGQFEWVTPIGNVYFDSRETVPK